MGAAYFYHLTKSPLESTLPMLLEKCRQVGWNVAVRGTSAERMEWLDNVLWSGKEDGFLPHGVAGGQFDADQPVLLTTSRDAANAPACVMAVDGAVVSAEEVDALERVCVLFDGNDPASLDSARSLWKALTQGGCSAQYWSQEGGSWAKKAESGATD